MQKFEVQSVPISELSLDPSNARAHPTVNIEAIKSSLRKFGQVEPLVVRKADNVVIGGNGRLVAMKDLGIERADVHFVDIDRTTATALGIALNRTAETAEWDNEVLGDLLNGLKEDSWDLGELGFELDDLEDMDLSDQQSGNAGLIDPDDVPEVNENEFKVQRGQIWKLGEHRVMCGDSTSREDVDLLMGGEKADMVFTDPPYGIDVVGKDGNIGGGTKSAPTTKFRKVIGDDKEFDASFCLEFSDKCFLWGGNFFAHKLPKGGRWFVWDKNRPEGLTLSDCELAWSNIDGVRVQKFKCTWDGYHKEGESGPRIHPNQKPIKLLVDVLEELKQNLVLDLFLGSGSTLIACEKTSRKCYGMEIDPHYCSVIIKRWQDYSGKKAELTDG